MAAEQRRQRADRMVQILVCSQFAAVIISTVVVVEAFNGGEVGFVFVFDGVSLEDVGGPGNRFLLSVIEKIGGELGVHGSSGRCLSEFDLGGSTVS